MICVTYKEHQMYPLCERSKVFVLRTQQLERLDVRMYAFMLDTDSTLWEKFESKKLGDICHTFLGATPKDANADEVSGVAFIKTKNVHAEYLDLSDVDYITEQAHKTTRKSSALKNGDILMTIIGASFEVIGRCLVYRNHPNPANINQNVIGIRVKEEIGLDPDFLCLQLNTVYGQMQVGQKAQRTAQFSLNKGLVEDFDVVIPGRDEQRSILERVNKLSELANSINRKASDLRLAEIQKLGVRVDKIFSNELIINFFIGKSNAHVFLLKHDEAERLDIPVNHPDYKRLVEQIKQSSESGSLSDLVEMSEERFSPAEYIGHEINYLAIGDIDGISGKIIEPQKMLAEELPSRARRLIHAGDILVGIAGASTGTENMVVFPVSSEQEGWVATTGFLVLRPRCGVDIHYVCSLLKAPFVLRQIRALLTSPAMPTISESDFMQLAVPVTNTETREVTLAEIKNVMGEERQITIQLEQIAWQIEKLLSQAKSNIFDLLDDDKFSAMSARAKDIEAAMAKVEEALQ